MTKAEKAGLKAYPENISYSTIGDVMYDYNAEKRRVYVAGYEQGYKDAVNKACEWLKNNHVEIFLRYLRGHDSEDEVEHFKKYMEEKQ
jgi:hypothetical protein